MAHLIETIYKQDIENVISILKNAHSEIVACVMGAQAQVGASVDFWGINIKRIEIELPEINGIVGKESEKFVEIINILATVERTISALVWFGKEFPRGIVRECHPSTSDNLQGNDIVLVDTNGSVIVRCEVCDVASSNAGQNGKEKSDIKNLGCFEGVPPDNVRRFIATSPEFSSALTSKKRKWNILPYRYVAHQTGLLDKTVLLEVFAKNT